ncbi:hypothetical protein PENTCL1PPCAC_19771, partial [Pristionchus entomophagus]
RMADKSNFVLRWEIENAVEAFQEGEVKSEVFKEGGFEWVAFALPQNENSRVICFHLACANQRGGEWKCEADVAFILCSRSGHDNYRKNHTVKMNNGNPAHKFARGFFWPSPFNQAKINGKIVVELHVNIICAEGNEATPILDLSKLISPNEINNVTLLIGDKKLRVSKDVLAVHSPVFSVMFFGNFAEKGKEEIEIKDVVYEEFIDLLNLIYLGTVEITDHTVLHILKLADQFQMERVTDLTTKHLAQSNGFETANKLLIADQY